MPSIVSSSRPIAGANALRQPIAGSSAPSIVSGDGTAAVITRALATNRNMLPTTTVSSANYVRHSRLQFRVPANANFSSIRAKWVGWGQNFGGEFNSPDAQTISASIEYGGVIYAADFSGSASTSCAAGSEVEATFPGLTLPAGATAIIITRAQGANTGAVNRIIGHGAHRIFGEGQLQSAVVGDNYVAGAYARNAVAAAPTVSGGNITACGVAQAGVNYTVGLNVYAYEVQPDGTIAWKVIGYCNPSGGGVASISVTSGTPPAGVAAWIAPTVVIANAFSNADAQVYAHCVITGIPSVVAKSVFIHGTSIEVGWGSTDSIGDLKRNFGIVERGVNNRCGLMNLAAPSQLYQGYQNQVTFAKTWAFLSSLSTQMGNANMYSYLGGATNDVQAGGTKVAIEGWLNAVRGYLVGYGHKVDFANLLPRTTGTIGAQAYDTGFGIGGVADGINTDVGNNTLVSNGSGPFDPHTQFQSGTDSRKWDATGTAKTDDLIHPNLVGTAFAQNNASWLSQFAGLS